MAVNGVVYDHESLQMEVAGIGESLTLMSVKYKCGKPKENVYGTHGLPRGEKRKKYEGSFECEIARTEFNALVEATSDTGVLGAPPFKVILVYGADGDEPIEDELEVSIDDFELGSEEDDEATVPITGHQTRVAILNGTPAYVDPLGRAE